MLGESFTRSDSAREIVGVNNGQANAGENIYIFYGTLDRPNDLPPKGEFFTKSRDGWMPEVPGESSNSHATKVVYEGEVMADLDSRSVSKARSIQIVLRFRNRSLGVAVGLPRRQS